MGCKSSRDGIPVRLAGRSSGRSSSSSVPSPPSHGLSEFYDFRHIGGERCSGVGLGGKSAPPVLKKATTRMIHAAPPRPTDPGRRAWRVMKILSPFFPLHRDVDTSDRTAHLLLNAAINQNQSSKAGKSSSHFRTVSHETTFPRPPCQDCQTLSATSPEAAGRSFVKHAKTAARR